MTDGAFVETEETFLLCLRELLRLGIGGSGRFKLSGTGLPFGDELLSITAEVNFDVGTGNRSE